MGRTADFMSHTHAVQWRQAVKTTSVLENAYGLPVLQRSQLVEFQQRSTTPWFNQIKEDPADLKQCDADLGSLAGSLICETPSPTIDDWNEPGAYMRHWASGSSAKRRFWSMGSLPRVSYFHPGGSDAESDDSIDD